MRTVSLIFLLFVIIVGILIHHAISHVSLDNKLVFAEKSDFINAIFTCASSHEGIVCMIILIIFGVVIGKVFT